MQKQIKGSQMAQQCHREFIPVGLEELVRFIDGVDSKIKFLLKGLRAQGHEITVIVRALQGLQQRMKERLRDMINTAFQLDIEVAVVEGFPDYKEGIVLVEALNRFFWKEEEQIDAGLNKCCDMLGPAWFKELKKENESADDLDKVKGPATSEEVQEPEIKANAPANSEESRELEIKPKSPGQIEGQETEKKANVPAKSEEGQEPKVKAKGPAKSKKSKKRKKKSKGPAKIEEVREPDIVPKSPIMCQEGEELIIPKSPAESEAGQELDTKPNGPADSKDTEEQIEPTVPVKSEDGAEPDLNPIDPAKIEEGQELDTKPNGPVDSKDGLEQIEPTVPVKSEDGEEQDVNPTDRAKIEGGQELTIEPTGPSVSEKGQELDMIDLKGPTEEEPERGAVDLKNSNDSFTGSDPVLPDTSRAEEVMTPMNAGISVTVEAKPVSDVDQLSADDDSLHESPKLREVADQNLTEFIDREITEEDCKAMDKTRNTQIEIGEVLLRLQESFARGWMHRATKIQFEVSLLLVELFLILSMNKKDELFKFEEFRSCLKNIKEKKRDVKATVWILKTLQVADKEFAKMKMSTDQEETCQSSEMDNDKLHKAGKVVVEELIDKFVALIAKLDGLMSSMAHLESRVLGDKAIRTFESIGKDMEERVQGIKSKLKVLRHGCSCSDSAAVLARIANVFYPRNDLEISDASV